jgi:hypothetical protein
VLASLALRVVNCALADTAEDDPMPLVNAGEGIYEGEALSPASAHAGASVRSNNGAK